MITKKNAIQMAKKLFGSLKTTIVIAKQTLHDEMLRPSGHYYMLMVTTATCSNSVWEGTVEELISRNPKFTELTVLQHGDPETTKEETITGRGLLKEYYDLSSAD